MQKRKLKDNKNLILWNNKYYVVNDLTYELLDMFDKNYSLDDISKKVGYRKNDIKIMYKNIEKSILAKNYYEDNLELTSPIKIHWKITNKCNLKCKHCYLGNLDDFELKYDKVMEITDIIIKSNVMEVTLSGGECLIYNGIENVILKLIKNDIKVNIFTNALLLKETLGKIDKHIEDKSKLLFYISVDGLKENHEKIRGNNTFDKTINNIRLAINSGYTVITNTVVNKINYEDIIEMVFLLKTIGVKDVQLSNLIVQGRATNDLGIDLKMQMDLKYKLSKMYEENPNFGYIYYSEVPDKNNIKKVYLLSSEKSKYIGNDNWKCTAGIARATIDSNGNVYCCPFIVESYLGNLNTQKLDTIWNNVNRYNFLKMLSEANSDRVCLAMKKGKKGN